jgi:hypothetical protein
MLKHYVIVMNLAHLQVRSKDSVKAQKRYKVKN